MVAPKWYELSQELVAEGKPGNGLVSALTEVFEPEPKPDYAAQFLSDFESGHAGSAAINAAEEQSRIEQEAREKEDRAKEERLRKHFGDEHFDRYIAEDIPKVERSEGSVPPPPDTFESDIFSNAARGTLETSPEPTAQPLPKEELPSAPESWSTQPADRVEPKFEDMLTAAVEPAAQIEEAVVGAPANEEQKTLEEQFPWAEAMAAPTQEAVNEYSSSWGTQPAQVESPFENVIQPAIADQEQAASLYEKLTDELAARQTQSDFFDEEAKLEKPLHSGTSAPASKWLEPLPKVDSAPAVAQEEPAVVAAEPVIEVPTPETAQPVTAEAELPATPPAEPAAEPAKPETQTPRVRPRDYSNPLKQSKSLGDLSKRETETTRMVPRNVPSMPLATPVSQDQLPTSSVQDAPAVSAPQAVTELETETTPAPAEIVAEVVAEVPAEIESAPAPAAAPAAAALPWVSQTNLPAATPASTPVQESVPAVPVTESIQEPIQEPAPAPATAAPPPWVSQTNLPAATPASTPVQESIPAVSEPTPEPVAAPAPATAAPPPWVSQTNLPAATPTAQSEQPAQTTAAAAPPPWVSQSRLPAAAAPEVPSPETPAPVPAPTPAPLPWVSQTKLPAAAAPETAVEAKGEATEAVKSTLPWVSQSSIPAQAPAAAVPTQAPAPASTPTPIPEPAAPAAAAQTNVPAVESEAEKKVGSQDARLMMNEMATLMSKLEQQVSKAANKLSSRAEELKTRLNKQVEDLLKQASEIERQSEVNLTNLSSELNTRLDNLAIEVRSNIARESAAGEDEIDKTGANGVDKLEQEQRQLSAQIVRTCTDFKSELETMSYGVSKRLEELIENRNNELASLRSSILDELKDSHESYTSTVEQRFERFRERMNEETVSVTKSLERNMRSMVEEIDSSLDRACEKLRSTRVDLEKTIAHTVATAEMSIAKRTKLILSDSIVPKLNEHKIILRTMIADMTKQIQSETQTGFARESRRLEDSTEKAARELRKVVEECFTDFERSGANLKAGLDETYKRAAYDLNQRIQEVHTYIKETEKRILESEHTLRSLAEASSVESEPDLVEERANALATLQTLKQDANRKMAASIENGLTRLEERSEELFSELTEKRSESTAMVRDAAESSLDKVRQALQEATAAIQSAREKHME